MSDAEHGIPTGYERQRPHDTRLRVVHESAPSQPQRDAMEFFRCHGCGEVIGVYEPLVVHDGSHARTTSRAAEPDLRATAAAYHHRDCYATSDEEELRREA
jgi:hypothetical protein